MSLFRRRHLVAHSPVAAAARRSPSSRIRAVLALGLGTAAAMTMMAERAGATETRAGGDPFPSAATALVPLSDDDLAERRGGFLVHGLDIRFAMTLTSTVQDSDGVTHRLITAYTIEPGRILPTTAGETGSIGNTLAGIGGLDLIHAVTADRITAVIRNQLDGVTIDHTARLDISVANFRARVGAFDAVRLSTAIGRGAALPGL